MYLCHSSAEAQDEDYTALQAVLASHEGTATLLVATALQLMSPAKAETETERLTVPELIGVVIGGVFAGTVCGCITLVVILAACCTRHTAVRLKE